MFRGRLLFGVLFFLAMHRHVPAAMGQPLPTVPAGRQSDAGREAGLPLIHNYHPRTYASASAAADNWTVLQDATGRIFVGNSAGVLLYNGVNWQSVETPTKSIIRSLALHPDGRLYAGASDDLGYLDRDAAGKLHFVSLLPHIPRAHRAFGDVWHTVVTPGGVYFLSSAHLFRWDGRQMHRLGADAKFTRLQ